MSAAGARDVLILGCGYTGRHIAARLLDAGHRVIATTRHPDALADLAAWGADIRYFKLPRQAELGRIPEASLVVHSIPLIRGASGLADPTRQILSLLSGTPARLVYLSTTGVYGPAREVDETTPAAPRTPREQLRVDAEAGVASGPWSWLVLRAAGIYGPDRGVHVSVQRGDYRLPGEGANVQSRIHVEDLATHVIAGLFSDLTGAFPVADEEPCTAREIAAYCSRLLGAPMPPSVDPAEVDETRRADRRVDGRAVRRLLGVELRYPSYRQGIPVAR